MTGWAAPAAAYVDWGAMWQILAVGLLGGAGLVAVYSFGLRLVSWANGGVDGAGARRWVGIGAGALCFAVVVGGVAYGIDVMLAK